jgi:hypothetical protein
MNIHDIVPSSFGDSRDAFKAALQLATEAARGNVLVAKYYSPEGDRLMRFRRVCPPQFMQRITPTLLTAPASFAEVAKWDGKFPGPLAVGPTGTAKSRAVWSALGRLWVREGRDFRWSSARQMTEKYFEVHMQGDPERFWRALGRFSLWFLDDVDKVEMNDRNAAVLFEFYDRAYREKRPVIATTNRDRAWWMARMGEAFCRRFFNEVHHAVTFHSQT